MSRPSQQPSAVVSVVMPVRNGGNAFVAAVESIRRQAFTQWELLVIDDGSTDGTRCRAERLSAEDSRIRLIPQEPAGIVAALNQGLQLSRAPWIARMDADDWAHPERLQQQLALLDRDSSIGLAACLVTYGGERNSGGGYSRYVEWTNSLISPEDMLLNRFIESPLAHPSVLFRRDCVERWGGYRGGDFPEDYELWLRWMEAGVRMAKVPRLLLTWNDPAERLSRTDARYSPEKFYHLKAPYLARQIERSRNGRAVWIWGAGRLTRRRMEPLVAELGGIAGFVDVDPAKAGVRHREGKVVLPDQLPGPEACLVVGAVSSWGAREHIRACLSGLRFREGIDFWMAA